MQFRNKFNIIIETETETETQYPGTAHDTHICVYKQIHTHNHTYIYYIINIGVIY